PPNQAPPLIAHTSVAPEPTSAPVTSAPPVVPTSAAAVPPPATQAVAPPAAQPACAADEYRNVDGNCVHRPQSAPAVPAGATAVCKDGTYSFSQNRQGTCSHHGGVARWL